MSLFRREVRQWAPEPIVPPFPGMTGIGGANPTVSSAMQVSAVWACVRLIADTVSMMPVGEYTIRNGVRTPLPPSPFVAKPSADASMPEWIYMLLVSALLRGNTFGHIVRRDQSGYPLQIELYGPDAVRCSTDAATGAVTYSVNGQEVSAFDVFHFRAFRFPGSRLGLSPIQYAATQINTNSAISDFAYGFFRDGAHPSSVLSSDHNFTPDQAKSIKDKFIAAIKGREPAVLSGGVKYTQVQVSPEESQFLATQKYGVAEIARIYGVPPEMIAAEAGNSMTYANVEQRGIDFLTYSIQPWLTRLESSLAQLLPGQRHIRFDTSVLTRTDFATLMTSTAVGIASKQMTVDEARAKRDEPPLTEGQKAELALVPLTVGPTGAPKPLPPAAPGGAE